MPATTAAAGTGLPRSLLTWLLSLGLSAPVRNPRRDFCNGYLLAEIVCKHSAHGSKLSLHSFSATDGSMARKRTQWALLTKFLGKQGIVVESNVVEDIINAVEGAIVPVLEAVKEWLKPISNPTAAPAYRSMETLPKVVKPNAREAAAMAAAAAPPPPPRREGGAAAAAFNVHPAPAPAPVYYAPYESGLEGAARSPGRPRAPPYQDEVPVLERAAYAAPPAAFVFGGTEYDRPVPAPTPAPARVVPQRSRAAEPPAHGGALAPEAQAYVPWGGAYAYAAEAAPEPTRAAKPPLHHAPAREEAAAPAPRRQSALRSPRSPGFGVQARTDSHAPVSPALPLPLHKPAAVPTPSLLTPEEREAARVRQARMATRRADERRAPQAPKSAPAAPAPGRQRSAAAAAAAAEAAVTEEDLRRQREASAMLARRDNERAERAGGYWALGALGSDKDPDELEAKRAKAAEAKALAQRWTAENRRRLAAAPAPAPPAAAEASARKEPSARDRAREFAKHVPKPSVSAEARATAAAPPKPFGGGPGRPNRGGTGSRRSAAAAAAPAPPAAVPVHAPKGGRTDGGLTEMELLELRHEEDRALAARLRRELGLGAA